MIEYNPEAIEGVVSITPINLYAKSPKSLTSLVDHLTKVGYDVRDISSEKRISGDKPPREVQEKGGWALWHGSLSDRVFEEKGECYSCKSLIDVKGIRSHEHKCEVCGDYTYVEYVNGGEITFSVADDPHPDLEDLTFVIHSYDKEKERLNLYENPEDCPERRPRMMRNFDLSPEESSEKVPELIEKFPYTFKRRKIKGIQILSVPDKPNGRVQEHGIRTWNTEGRKINHRIVKLFNGRKFVEGYPLPVPEFISIYEAWHWAPLEPRPNLYETIMFAAGQVPKKDYYYQDGRPAFNYTQINGMLKFIDHFTTVDVGKVRPYLHAGLSGPGLIDVLAKLTGHDAYIETAPNIGNAIEFISKLSRALNGEKINITKEETDAAAIAISHDMKHDNILGSILFDKKRKKK